MYKVGDFLWLYVYTHTHTHTYIYIFCGPAIHLSIPSVYVFVWNLQANVAIPLTFRKQYNSDKRNNEQLILLYRNENVEALKQKRVVRSNIGNLSDVNNWAEVRGERM